MFGYFLKCLQIFEVGRSMIRYKKLKISFESRNNLILGRKKIRFVFVAKFQIFHEISQKFRENSKIFEKQKISRSEIFVSICKIVNFCVDYFLNFFESTRNGLIDGQKNAGASHIQIDLYTTILIKFYKMSKITYF